MEVEFKVRPVTRYVVTRYEDGPDKRSSLCGEFDNETLAEQTAGAMREQADRFALRGNQEQSMGLIEREYHRLNNALNLSVGDPRYPEIYAAQQALAWAMNPSMAMPPSAYFQAA